MKAGLLVVTFFLAVFSPANADDKPVIYNPVHQDSTARDQAEKAAWNEKYTIIDLVDSPDFTPPKLTRGSMPPSPKTATGETLAGYVLLAYVITADGHASDPTVLKSTNAQLNQVASDATASWSFEPAKLKGVPVGTTAAQEFNFTEPASKKGFAVDNIVLYQPNDVLVQRLPGPDQLAAYIKQLQSILTDYFQNDVTPETFQTVVAVRPGNQSRVWFVSSTRTGASMYLDSLQRKLESIKPVDVKDGPVAFAISGSIAGGDGKNPKSDKNFQPPIPKEWQDAGKDLKPPVLVPDGYLNIVWPEK